MEKNQAVSAINFIDLISQITQLKNVNYLLSSIINEGINKIINKTKNRLPDNIKFIWNKINSNSNLTSDEFCCLGKWFADNVVNYQAEKATIKSIDYFQQRHPSIMAFICFFSAGEIFKSAEAWENLARFCYNCEKKNFFILTKEYSKKGLDYYTGALGQDKTHIQTYLAFHFYISAYNVYEAQNSKEDYQQKANNILEECLLLCEERKIEQSPGSKKSLHKSLADYILPVVRVAINVNADIQEKKEELFTDILSYLLDNLSTNKNEVLKNKLFRQLSIHLLTICQNKSLNKAIEIFEKLYKASSDDDLKLMLIGTLTELLKNSQFRLDNAQEKLSDIFNLLTVIQTDNKSEQTNYFFKLISIIQNRLKTPQTYHTFKELYHNNQDKLAKYMAFIALIDLIKQTKKSAFGNYFNKCVTTIFEYADEIIASGMFIEEIKENLKDLTEAINIKLTYNEACLLNNNLIKLTKYDFVKLIIYDGLLNLIDTHETHPYEFNYYEALLNKLFDILNELSHIDEAVKENNFLKLITVIGNKTRHQNNLYELIKRSKIYDKSQNTFIKLTLLEKLIISLRQAKFDNKKPEEKNQKLAIHTASILQNLKTVEHGMDVERRNQLYADAISIIETQAKALYPEELSQQFKLYVVVIVNWLENKDIDTAHSIKPIQQLSKLISSLTLKGTSAVNIVEKIHLLFVNHFDLNNLFKNKEHRFTEIIFKLYKNLFNRIETYCKQTLLNVTRVNEETKEKNEKIIGFITVLATQTINSAYKPKALALLINIYEKYLALSQKNKLSLSTFEKEQLCANLAYYKLQQLVVKINLDYDYSIQKKRLSIDAKAISQFIQQLYIDNRDFNFLLTEKKNIQHFSFSLIKTTEHYKITAQTDKNTLQISFKEGLLKSPVADVLNEWKNAISIFIENLQGITLARIDYIVALKTTAVSKNNTNEEQGELNKLKALSGLLNILLENPLDISSVPAYLSDQDFSNHPELKSRSSQRFSSLNLSNLVTTETMINLSKSHETEINSAENSDLENESSAESNLFMSTESLDYEKENENENDVLNPTVSTSDPVFSFESESTSIEYDTKKSDTVENISGPIVESTDSHIKDKPENTTKISVEAQELPKTVSTYSVIATTLSPSEDKIIFDQEMDSSHITGIVTSNTVPPPPPLPNSQQLKMDDVPPPPPMPVVLSVSTNPNTLSETVVPGQALITNISFSESILSRRASLRKIDMNNPDGKESSITNEPETLAAIMAKKMRERRDDLVETGESGCATDNVWSDDEKEQNTITFNNS